MCKCDWIRLEKLKKSCYGYWAHEDFGCVWGLLVQGGDGVAWFGPGPKEYREYGSVCYLGETHPGQFVSAPNLRKDREDADVRMGVLARWLGISVTMLSDVERGNEKITHEKLEAAYQFLDAYKEYTQGCKARGVKPFAADKYDPVVGVNPMFKEEKL